MKDLLEGEVREAQASLPSDTKLLYVIVNKRVDAKF